MDTIEDLLIRHEGKRLRLYQDTKGKWTIGIGRNLSDKGISHDEMLYLLRNDIKECENDCLHSFPWFADLDPVRKNVILDMRFNLGGDGLRKFQKMLLAMNLGEYGKAANEILNSKAAAELPARYEELAEMMRIGTIG